MSEAWSTVHSSPTGRMVTATPLVRTSTFALQYATEFSHIPNLFVCMDMRHIV